MFEVFLLFFVLQAGPVYVRLTSIHVPPLILRMITHLFNNLSHTYKIGNVRPITPYVATIVLDDCGLHMHPEQEKIA